MSNNAFIVKKEIHPKYNFSSAVFHERLYPDVYVVYKAVGICSCCKKEDSRIKIATFEHKEKAEEYVEFKNLEQGC